MLNIQNVFASQLTLEQIAMLYYKRWTIEKAMSALAIGKHHLHQRLLSEIAVDPLF